MVAFSNLQRCFSSNNYEDYTFYFKCDAFFLIITKITRFIFNVTIISPTKNVLEKIVSQLSDRSTVQHEAPCGEIR